MRHPGPLFADGTVEARIVAGACRAIDDAAAADRPERGFLRSAWFEAGAAGAELTSLVGHDSAGAPIATIPLIGRAVGPLRLREVPGSYWPWRSFPVAADAGAEALARLLASREARAALGHAWRLGPVRSDDPAVRLLTEAAPQAGWTLVERVIATCFVVDLADLAEAGPWPSSKTLRKNRWLERRLAEQGELAFSQFSGEQWSPALFDLLAAIEADSWVGRKHGDCKFLRPENRRVWERMIADPDIAAGLRCSILHVGNAPAAFTFALRAGNRLHFIANGYGERFAGGSPGRILLYRDLQRARDEGVETIDWGAGDPGYKSEMGARGGPELVDLLVVRRPLPIRLIRRFWRANPAR